MEKPKAFVLYPNQWGPLSCLTDEQLGRLLRHIFCWLNDESLDIKKEERLVEPDILLAFRFMQMQINIDIEKYQQISEKRRAAVNKRWDKNKENDTNVSFVIHKKEKENEKEREKESEKESENENEKEKEKEKESSSKAAEGNSAVSEFGSAAWQRNFIAFFNRCVEGSNIPCIRTLTAERIEALRKLREAIKASNGQMRNTEFVFKQAARRGGIRYAGFEKQKKTPKTKENIWSLSVYTLNVFSCF